MFDLFSNAVVDVESAEIKMIEQGCLANLEDNVADPVLRERLRPDHRAACKRLILSPDFYDAIQRPNAELVTEAIERIEAGGVRTSDGRLHQLDVLVLATGFKADAFMRPMEVVGRDGITLEEAWTPRPEAYLSVSVPDFPNFFMLNGPNGPIGNFSLIEVAELQFRYIIQLIDRLRSGDCREVCATRARPWPSSNGPGTRPPTGRYGSPAVRAGTSTTGACRPGGRGRSPVREEMRAPDPAAYDCA